MAMRSFCKMVLAVSDSQNWTVIVLIFSKLNGFHHLRSDLSVPSSCHIAKR